MPYRSFIGALLDAKNPRSTFFHLRATGLASEDFADPESRLTYDFLVTYCSRYTGFPDRVVVKGELGLGFPVVTQPVEYWSDKIREISLLTFIKNTSSELQDAVTRGDAKAVSERVGEMYRQTSQLRSGAHAVEFMSYAEQVVQDYESAKRGEMGVPLPWPHLNVTTRGLLPEDLCLFVARPAVGKSWTLLLCLYAAWKAGKRCLLVTTEMSARALLRRFASLELRLPYGHVYHGKLDDYSEQRFREFLAEYADGVDSHIKIVSGGFDFTVEAVSAAIEDAEPEVAYVDGLYLLKSSVATGSKKTEQIAEVFNELKRMAKGYSIPLVATTQFNREAKEKSSKSNTNALENISLSDAGGWNADLAFSLVRPDIPNRLIVTCMKARESVILPLEVSWDFERMDFSQIGTSAVSLQSNQSAATVTSQPDDDAPF